MIFIARACSPSILLATPHSHACVHHRVAVSHRCAAFITYNRTPSASVNTEKLTRNKVENFFLLHAFSRGPRWSLRADLDPLKAQLRKREKLLQQEQLQRKQQQQQQQEMGAQTGAAEASAEFGGAVKAEKPRDEQQDVGKAAAAPMPTVQRVNAADAAQWRRTDNIIMAVLS
eukprot:scaffold45225_cov17-Tisochrysis_lutea.AAC.1